ncbi:Uncharacterised protein [Bordetella pertussis]|nr:Uncharacterised protein [Bordetella pertussis]
MLQYLPSYGLVQAPMTGCPLLTKTAHSLLLVLESRRVAVTLL